jgi:hypothetical protein
LFSATALLLGAARLIAARSKAEVTRISALV